jgi:hypothetical protein
MSSPESPLPGELRGGCECGAVTYRVLDAFAYAMNCHCSHCRAATGSAFKAIAGIEREKLVLTSGEEQLWRIGEPDGYDARCGACGSFLYSIVRAGEWAHVAMGSLIDAPSVRPDHHIFVGSKAPWFEITDGLPEHEEYGGR